MSVYIKGMEMPSSCCACNLCTKYLFETPPFCDVTMKRIDDWSKRSDDCPLIPVPDHGRLVDADEAIGHLFNGEQCLYSWDEIEEAIDATETVIPAEEGE